MNVYESEIMNILCKEHFVNQRILAETTGHSIGSVNKSLRQLAQDGYLDNNMQFTDKGRQEIRAKAPRNAIILAAERRAADREDDPPAPRGRRHEHHGGGRLHERAV